MSQRDPSFDAPIRPVRLGPIACEVERRRGRQRPHAPRRAAAALSAALHRPAGAVGPRAAGAGVPRPPPAGRAEDRRVGNPDLRRHAAQGEGDRPVAAGARARRRAAGDDPVGERLRQPAAGAGLHARRRSVRAGDAGVLAAVAGPREAEVPERARASGAGLCIQRRGLRACRARGLPRGGVRRQRCRRRCHAVLRAAGRRAGRRGRRGLRRDPARAGGQGDVHLRAPPASRRA